MTKRDTFKDFVLEQLGRLEGVNCRGMFGGHGLYLDEKFFGILAQGRMYFKTNEKSRGDYEKLGMKPFQASKKQILKNYYEVPSDVLEDAETLELWVRKAAQSLK